MPKLQFRFLRPTAFEAGNTQTREMHYSLLLSICTVAITVTEICKHSARVLGCDLNPHLPVYDI